MAGPAGREFFRVVAGVAPGDVRFRYVCLGRQRQGMGFMASHAYRNALLIFPVVRHVAVRVDLLSVFGRDVLRPGNEVVERPVAFEAGVPVPGLDLGRRSLRLRRRARRLGDGQGRCQKAAERQNKEGPCCRFPHDPISFSPADRAARLDSLGEGGGSPFPQCRFIYSGVSCAAV